MSDETERIKERLDIAEIVGEYVVLKRAGQYFKGLCPFHQEKTPSFIVSPDRGTWHCFGACSEGGDVFSFVQKVEGIDFVGALKLLAPRAGVELAARSKPALRRAQSRRERLFDVLEKTARFYHEVLINQAAGAKARDYLAQRGVTVDSMREFQIGYAPQQWEGLQTWLRAGGFSPAEMVAVAVAGTSSRGKLYDRFRGRIMFPIHDRQGRVVAFGGRIAPWHETGEEGKYINSPETELYQKRRTIYNLHRAKQYLRAQQACVVVEGYMDVVLLNQIGVQNVVASSGTAFTTEHITELKRFTTTLTFAFDADQAGVKAAIAATTAALAAGMRVATVMLPEGQDPADAAQQAPDELKRLLASPRSLVSVLLDRLRASAGADDREEYLAALVPLVAGVANAVQQGEMVQEMARLLALPEARVLQLLAQYRPASAKAPTFAKASAGKSAGEPAQEAVEAPDRLASTEHYLVGLLATRPAVRHKLLPEITAELFSDPQAQRLYFLVCEAGEEAFEQLLSRVPAELTSYADGVRSLSEERLSHSRSDPVAEGEALLTALRRLRLHQRLAALQTDLIRGNDKQRAAALHQFQAVVAELSRLHERS